MRRLPEMTSNIKLDIIALLRVFNKASVELQT